MQVECRYQGGATPYLSFSFLKRLCWGVDSASTTNDFHTTVGALEPIMVPLQVHRLHLGQKIYTNQEAAMVTQKEYKIENYMKLQ